MRIRFVNQYYWPDVASTGQHLTDLAEHLAASGHQVQVVCSRGGYLDGQAGSRRREVKDGVEIVRVGTVGRGQRRGLLWRLIEYASFHLAAGVRVALGGGADVNVTLTTPPLLGLWGRLGQGLRGTRHVVWSMDLHPDAEFSLGMLRERSITGRALAWLHAAPLREADRVVALGPYMRDRIAAKGVPEHRIEEIPVWNWAGRGAGADGAARELRRERGWDGRFVVMYSGNAGLVHRFDELCQAIERVAERAPEVLFAFVGGGPRRAELERLARERGWTNVEFHGYVPREAVEASLRSADAHFLSLEPEQTGIAVPSKLYGAFASERPVFFVGAARCESADAIREAGAGWCFEPGAGEELAGAICGLAADPASGRDLGIAGRRAFEARFEQGVCCRAWAELFDIAGSSPVEPPALAA